MTIAGIALLATAAALAWIIARLRPEHRPIALALTVGLAADVVRAILVRYFPPNLNPDSPLRTGAALAAAYVDRALFIVWPFALAAAAVRVLARWPAWPFAIGYVVAASVLIAGYPSLRHETLRKTYLALDLLVLVPATGALAAWWIRGWRSARAGEPPRADYSGRAVAMLVAGQIGIVISGPYRIGLFGEAWELAIVGYVLIIGAVVLLQLLEVLTW